VKVRKTDDVTTLDKSNDKYDWFYEGRNGWWQYDERASTALEEAFKSEVRSCELLVAGFLYIIDFQNMVQYRKTNPLRCRRVKRDRANIDRKGIAGLKEMVKTVENESNNCSNDTVSNRTDAIETQIDESINVISNQVVVATSPVDSVNGIRPVDSIDELRPADSIDEIRPVDSVDQIRQRLSRLNTADTK